MLIRERFHLAKLWLCLLIGGSTLFGYILAARTLNLLGCFITLGVFLLAAGAASINSIQDCNLDKQFERTKGRPMPMGQVTTGQAIFQGMALLLGGISLLAWSSQKLSITACGLAAVVLYNGLYTPLKHRSIWAILPGSICGALPPLIGWLGGGGDLVGYPSSLLFALLVLWQVPHFWLVLLQYPEDYRSGLVPNFLARFDENRLKRLILPWIGALVLVMLLFLSLPQQENLAFAVLITLNCSVLLSFFVSELLVRRNSNYRRLFFLLNMSLLVHMLSNSVFVLII
jgi:protoheme IX farnesyltransferase